MSNPVVMLAFFKCYYCNILFALKYGAYDNVNNNNKKITSWQRWLSVLSDLTCNSTNVLPPYRFSDHDVGDSDQDNELNNKSYNIDTDTDLLTASDSEDSKYNLDLESYNSNGEETDSDIDKEYFIFPISLEKADDVCIRLDS